MFKSKANERGQAIVVLAMSMVVLLLMGASAIDGGRCTRKSVRRKTPATLGR